jgi:HlyD family secretion protein
VEANIIISSKEKALTIPTDYLVNGEFVISSDGEKMKVVIGLKDYQQAEILKGLTTHDAIRKPVK